jgi:glutaconate CoA-transferase subunit A
LLIDLLVEHPGAVAPDGVAGLYERDVAAYEEYAEVGS